jgi:hypothetical protein
MGLGLLSIYATCKSSPSPLQTSYTNQVNLAYA